MVRRLTRPNLGWGLLLMAGCAAAPPVSPSPDASTPVTVESVVPPPPVAAQKLHEVRAPHGAVRQDEYYWLRDDSRSNLEVLDYLKAENAYTDAWMARLQPLRERIYAEITARIPANDDSVPYRYHGDWYQTRYVAGGEYPLIVRRVGAADAPEQVLLDGNAMAKGKDYFDIGYWVLSPDHRRLAWAEDDTGRRQYVIHVKDLASGDPLPDVIDNTSGDIVWSGDNRTLLYIENDPETLLTKRVKSHVLGRPASADRTLYEERDDSFFLGLARTRSEKYICISAASTVSSEQRCALTAKPTNFRVLAPRRRDFLYQADQLGDRWVILTDWNAANSRLMTTADGQWGDRRRWRELRPHSDQVLLENFELFDHAIVLQERSDGLERLRILGDDGREQLVAADEPAYTMSLGMNAEPGNDRLRYTYDSLTTPETTYEVDLRGGERQLLKRQPVPGYDPANYVSERVWATARDGTKIPVSLVYRKGFRKDGHAALLQYGYGSYGLSEDPYFANSVVSLLDRGMVYAVAHIRGGEEMGRHWYDDGKLAHKMHSFTDFIDVTRFLVQQGYAASDRVAAEGGSAGGLLMGAVANLAPDDYRVIVAQVPFVDVVTTMLDDSVPLTTNEYDEWGDPRKPADYATMLAYSPYDNVERKAYPAFYISSGLWDSQVQYYEPTKWVARLRARKTDSHPLLFRVHMDAGHSGESGRYQSYEEDAESEAFLLDQLGVAKP